MIAKNKGTGEAVSDPEEDKQAANPPHHDKYDGNEKELWGQEFPKWSVTPSDRGFSVRGERTEGVGHKPDALRTLSEPPGDSGAVPGEGAVAAHLPREWRATCTAPAAPGHGTAVWIAVPLQFFYAPRSQRCF